MKNFHTLSLFAVLLTIGLLTTAQAQIRPSQDAYTNSATATKNFGTSPVLDVESPSQTTYIQFDLSSIPSGYTSASIAKATLKLYVNAVTTAGSFNVDFVNSTWSEKTITANLSPTLGTTIASSVPLTAAQVHDYVLIDVTSALGAWLDGTQANHGIALVGNSPINATFDSKENTTNSQPPELDIVYTIGGTITGVNTAAGSGLIGGGTSGTLNLGLTKSCATNQVLQWNGSAWACSSAGSGTVTNVGTGPGLTGGPITSSGTIGIAPSGVTNAMLANPSLTMATGTGLTGGGTVALGGSITLSLDTSKVPELTTANSFTGNQNVTGNLAVVNNASFEPFSVQSSSTFGTWMNLGNTSSGGHTWNIISAGGSNAEGAGNFGITDLTGKSTIWLEGNVNAGTLVTGSTAINNMGCGGGFGGIGFGAKGSTGCANYSLLGEGVHTYLNRPTGGQILFRENNATEMVLASGGNLGIGTATPAFLLHVNGTARAETGLSLGGNATLGVDAPGVAGGHFTVLPNGTVGINNPNPTHALDVHGAVSINGDAPMTSNPRMSFSGYAGGSFCGNLNCGGGFAAGPVGFLVPDKNIEITHLSVALASLMDPSCNAQITISVNGTLMFSLAVPGNTANFDGPTTVQANAGDQVVLSYTPATSCSVGASAGGDAMINATYLIE